MNRDAVLKEISRIESDIEDVNKDIEESERYKDNEELNYLYDELENLKNAQKLLRSRLEELD